jgi:hypothetical protein
MNFKGTIEIDIDDSVKGEFIEAHDLIFYIVII